ncbi:hypothetical protein HZA97_02330 [Candidatus Woesearchaeota archaeon]|nr:hypothetical protein [Candidatus Woesearchaeota archaeon]
MTTATNKGFTNGNGCFYDSLANLLKFLGDADTAKMVLEKSRYYHLKTPPNGIFMGTQTRAVHELTEGCYKARMAMQRLDEAQELQLIKQFGDRAGEVVRLIEEEFRAGNLRTPDLENNSARCAPPGIVFTKGYFVLKDQGDGTAITLEKKFDDGHAVVKLDAKTFIDRGFVISYDLSGFTTTGYLELEKTNPLVKYFKSLRTGFFNKK